MFLIAVNSHTHYIWIVNVITDSNTCLLSVSGVFLLFRWSNSMCKGVSVCVCVCVCVYMITY